MTPTPSADPKAVWVMAAPYPPGAALTAATAELADDTGSFANAAYSNYQTAFTLTPVTTVPTYMLWSVSECDWAIDTLTADRGADLWDAAQNPVGSSTYTYYQWSAANWGNALQDAQDVCAGTVPPSPRPTTDITYFQQAATTHANYMASHGGSADTWDVTWADAYLELGQLFQELPTAPSVGSG